MGFTTAVVAIVLLLITFAESAVGQEPIHEHSAPLDG